MSGLSVFLRRKLLLGLTACAVLGSVGGCHRAMYRQQADDEARALVEEKSCDPRWAMPSFNIEMNPASRYYDQHDPVKPPMPPDDPEAHELMHCVYGKKGWSKWHENGDRSGLENPVWQQCLDQFVPRAPSGAYVLRLEDSVRLALIHSPNYQQQLETLYLSSLDVSTERFRLQTQFFAGNSTTYNGRGNLAGTSPRGGVGNSTQGGTAGVPYGGGSGGASLSPHTKTIVTGTRTVLIEDPNNPGSVISTVVPTTAQVPLGTNTLNTTTGAQFVRRFATAGELVVGFANTFVWQFAGPDQQASASLASFAFIQPLLKNGGKVIGLERLTLAERVLLGNVRSMYRYRQGFFTQIAIGDNTGVNGPQRRGGFQGAGLEGFSGLGTSGFAGQGDLSGLGRAANTGGGGNGSSGTTGFVGGGAGTQNGFIGLLQRTQQIRTSQELLKAQGRTRLLLEANLAAGLIDIGQVDQFRQSIETEKATLLQNRNDLANQLDAFKTGTLGLPPHVPIELNDSVIQQFQFIAPGISSVQDGLAQILLDLGELDDRPQVAEVEAIADRIGAMRRDIDEQFGAVLSDLQRLDTLDVGVRFKDVTPEDQQATRDEWARLKETRERLLGNHADTGVKLSEIRAELTPATTTKVMSQLVTLSVQMDNIVKELSLVQARSRLEVITVEPLELHPMDALAIARANRVDWMNNRASLVDTWRLIEFNANALESGIDLVFSGDVGTTGQNDPFNFSHTTGGLRAGLRFDAPFTRLQERNNYRQQLINYQQARRQLVQFEDGVHSRLRGLLRQLSQLRTNLEIQRRAMAIAIRRVDLARENLNKPVAAAAPGSAPQQFGPTAARDLLDALSDLRSVQNNVMSVWLAYYASHMTLIRDLGVMQLDENGLWVAQPLDQFERMRADECLLPPAIPDQWFKDLDAAGTSGGSASRTSESEATPTPTMSPPPLPAPPAPRDPAMGPDAAMAPTKPGPHDENRWWPLRRKEPLAPRTFNVQAVAAVQGLPSGKSDMGAAK
ncbi:MAG: TolC family protein [Planctomycetaceae bacterium]